MRGKTLLASGVGLAAIVLPSALAGTVSMQPRGLVYEASVGEINEVSVVEAPDQVFTISDLGAAITPAATECTAISPNTVRCEMQPDFERVYVFTYDGADSVTLRSHLTAAYGGDDPDLLIGFSDATLLHGGGGDDRLVGRSGEQWLYGGPGADSLDGGVGDDYLQGGAGTDVISGGGGRDAVSYTDHTVQVTISLDGLENDGAAGEDDWIRADVENALGSRGPTTFLGNAGPNWFFGGQGADVVRAGGGEDFIWVRGGRDFVRAGAGPDFVGGGGGADLLLGGPGEDALFGLEGEDDLRGGRGDDGLLGGAGNDVLRGGSGHDELEGGLAADVLYARDRSWDEVGGGSGQDRAHVDSVDRLFRVEMLF